MVEKTRQDDDWARIEPYFRDDAVYRVESTVFGCEISGARSLLAGMRKSLEGFDRKMHRLATCKIEMTEPPKAEGDEVRLAWTVTGPNGSAKSAVIDAIEFALTGQIGRLSGSRGSTGTRSFPGTRTCPDRVAHGWGPGLR